MSDCLGTELEERTDSKKAQENLLVFLFKVFLLFKGEKNEVEQRSNKAIFKIM